MKKGSYLEQKTRELFRHYLAKGVWCQQCFPRTLIGGKIVERHGYDFEILYKGKFYAFDTKECSREKWYLDKATPHQVDALLSVKRNKGEGFFLVLFVKTGILVKYDCEVVLQAIQDDKKSLSVCDGKETKRDLLGVF